MGVNRTILVIFLIVCSNTAWAQVNRYMVFFTDKAGSTYTTTNPIQFLSQRAIDRRLTQGISITEQDLPVNDSYVQTLRDEGINVFFKSRWANAVLVQGDAAIVPVLESQPFVDRVELVAPSARLLTSGRRKADQRIKSTKSLGATATQLQMLGIDEMHSAGFKGQDIIIGVFDSGFQGVDVTEPFQHIFSSGRIDLAASKDFVFNTSNVFQYDDHGTEVFSVIAAFQDGAFTGGAYQATYQLYVTEDVSTEYRIEEYNWLFAAERADSAGVDIINSSLGYYDFDDASMNYTKANMDGQTTVVTRAAQWAADRGIITVCSAGNEGGIAWQIVTAPADAADVLAIGSVSSSGIRVGSSSKGPTADGRIKPDVAAMGLNTSVIRASGSNGFASGTSLSAPLVTSLVAGVWQRYPHLTNLEVMELIRNTASQATSLDNLVGYGIPNFTAVVNFMEQQPQEEAFVVYPNPVYNDSITIRPADPTEVAIESCKLEIVSSVGLLVYSQDVNFSWTNRAHTIDMATMAAGLYFVRIKLPDRMYVFKIIKG